jgi:hypothetical protein
MKRINFFVVMMSMFLSCSVGAMNENKSSKNDSDGPAFAIMILQNHDYTVSVSSEKTWVNYIPELSRLTTNQTYQKKKISNLYCYDSELKKWIDTQKTESLLFGDKQFNKTSHLTIPRCVVCNDDNTFKDSILIEFNEKKIPVFILSEDEVSGHIKERKEQGITNQVANYDIDKSWEKLANEFDSIVIKNFSDKQEKLENNDDDELIDDSTEKVNEVSNGINYAQVSTISSNKTKLWRHLLMDMVADMRDNSVDMFNNYAITYALQLYEDIIFLNDNLKKHVDFEKKKQMQKEYKEREKEVLEDVIDRFYSDKSKDDQLDQKENTENELKKDDQTGKYKFPNVSFLYDAAWKKGIFGASIFVLVCAFLQSEAGQNWLNNINFSY